MIEQDRRKWEDFARAMKVLPEQYADAKEELERIAEDERRKRRRKEDRRLLREVARPMGEGFLSISADEGEYVAECVRILSKERAWTQDYARDVCRLLWKEFGPGDKQERLDELLIEAGLRGKAQYLKTVANRCINTLEGIVVPWHLKSVSGLHFSPRTELRFADGAPLVFYEHGRQDGGGVKIGHALASQEREAGLWMRAQLALRDRYEAMIRKLIKAEQLAFEPGLASLQVASDGQIRTAAVPEVSFVPVDHMALGSLLSGEELRRFSYHSPAIKALVATL